LHRAVKSATALLGAVVALQAVTVTGAFAATGNYATTRSAHNLLDSTKLASTEHIGGTIVIGGVAGAKAAVTFVKVIDPARATEQFVTQTAGTRFVGLEFRLVSQGSGLFPGADSVLDVTAKGSNSVGYTSVKSEAYTSIIVGCKNLDNEKAALARGQSVTGCVVFTIPDGVKVAKVIYSEPGGTKGEWDVS
jgi:hypothetical protein